jgi:vitamin B12/bleomycin/antimicrobial peptide transport system ATP-binding/permease protein
MDLPREECLTARHYTTWQIIKAYWQFNRSVSVYIYYSILALAAAILIGGIAGYNYWHGYFNTPAPIVASVHVKEGVLAIVLGLGLVYTLLAIYRFMFTIAIMMTITLVGFDVVFNYWYNHFYNALQEYDQKGVVRLLIMFFIIAGFYIVLAVYRYYITQLFGLRWRRWLTEQFMGRWLQNRTYYLLENFDEKTDNPDQRIQEDVGALVDNTMSLTMGMVSAVTTFLAFIYILWTLSGEFTLPSWLGSYKVPGYLVWVGVIYAIIGTLLTIKLGRPLVSLNFEQQRREATFRYAAIDLRTHAENVALYHGEAQQRNIMQRLFDRVLENWLGIVLRQKMLMWFTAGYNQLSVLLPLLVALPNYFSKKFMLGGLIQSLQAFNRVQDSLSFLINSYTQIAQWQAICKRLTTFVNHMNEAEERAQGQNKLIFNKQSYNGIIARNISASTPRGEALLTGVNEEFKHGNHYLISGHSGLGKSTFIRALSGIWPYSSGEAIFPDDKMIMYVPQRPYMPIGTLREAILFPDTENVELAKEVEGVLKVCHLEYLIPRLSEAAAWSDQLSPGEQQRIAFARILLQKPDWVFLDESTSMLDHANEDRMYQLIKSELPHCSIVSVGHRSSLEKLHDHLVSLEKYRVKNIKPA